MAPWEKYAQPAAPAAGMVPLTGPDPRRVADVQMAPYQVEQARADAQKAPYEVEGARLGVEERRVNLATAPFEVQKAQADARKAQLEADKAAKGGEEDEKSARSRAALDSIIDQINRVQELYGTNLASEGPGNLFGLTDVLPSPANSQFNTAGAGLAEQGLAAFRVPGIGAQSDLEAAQFARANTPAASDYDIAIEEKLENLRRRVDANREALGLPPAQWAGKSAMPVAEDRDVVVPGAAAPGGMDRSRNAGEIETGPGSPSVGFNTDAVRYEDDPQLAGVKAEYRNRLGAGQSASEIVGWLRSVGVTSPEVLRSAATQVAFRRKNPNVPIGNYSIEALDDRAIPQSVMRQLTNVAADTPAGAFVMNAGDAVTGFNLDSMTAHPELSRLGLGQVNALHPMSALAGQVVGGGAAVLGAEASLARIGIGNALGRGLAADVGYGAAAGAGASDDNRLLGAAVGAGAGLAGNVGGRAVTGAVGRAVGGVSDTSTQNLRSQGVPLTLGQAVGRSSGVAGQTVKGIEDRMSGIPGVGDMVNARRSEGLETWNKKAFDRALKPIDARIGDKIGEEAVAEAQQKVSQAYARALNGKAAVVDGQFAPEMTRGLSQVQKLPRLGAEVEDQVEHLFRSYFDQSGTLTGENMQALLQELGGLKRAYKNDPLGNRIGSAIGQIESAVEGLYRRQAPEVMPDYNRAKVAYRRVSVLEDAVLRGKNNEGQFTPAQLGAADRANATKFGGKRGAAAGRGSFHDMQRDAQNVLPNRIPDSGTAGRLATMALPGALGGSGAAVGYAAGDAQAGAGAGLGIAGLLALSYTRTGQRALVGAVAKRSQGARNAGKAIQSYGPRAGVIAGGATPALIFGQ